MTKRLLNLHTITKIALILTTLLLLPSVAWATKYTTTGRQVKPMTGTNANVHYGWDVNNGNKWTISYESEDVSITSGETVTTLQFRLKAGKTMTLSTSKPNDGSGNFRKISLVGLNENLFTTVTFGSDTLTSISTEVFAPESPIKWESQGITITITNNQSEEISCTINSISFLTGTPGSATLTWADEATSPTGTNYDVSEIVKSVSGDNISLTGRCEQDATFRFQLYSSLSSHTINYSSSNTSVAQVDNNGIVTVKSAGEATITATPEGDDYNYYLPSSYRLIIQDIYQFCDLIVKGRRVTTGNRENILKDANYTVTFDGYQTLSLNGANLNDDGIISSRSALTIKITGTNKITVSTPSDACIISTNGGAITIESNEDGSTENSLMLISGEGGSAISGVGSITLDSRLHAIPSYESSPSEWTNKARDIFISNKQIYNIDIAGTQVTEGNLNNILNDDYKSVSYNPTTYTLTLKGAKIEDKSITIGEGISTLNIHLVGYNQISSIICKGSTTINITTSETLPGSLHFFKSIPETISLKNGLVRKDGEISTTKTNTIVSAFTGYVNVVNVVADSTPSYIYSYGKEYYASHATQTGSMIVVSPQNGGTETALWPSSLSDLEDLKKVYLQFDWGSCTNKDVTVLIKGLSNNEGATDGKEYSNTVSLSTADDDGIVEIPITRTITSENIELYFTSNETFSLVPLVVAMETSDLKIGETLVTELNSTNVLGDGTIKYDSETNTLTLKNASITTEENSDYPGIIYRGQKPLNIKLEGTNTMTNSVFRWFGEADIHPDLNFIIDTDNPGTLTMTNDNISSDSYAFTNQYVMPNFIDGFSINYVNANYDYNRELKQNQAETYIGTYKISILKPSIWTSIEDKRYFTAENPMAETNTGTIKYTVVYADGTQGISDQTYSDPYPLKGPATVTSYIAYPNGKNSGTATGYYFGVSPKTQKLVYGTEAPTLNLQLTPQVEGVHINNYMVYSYFASTTDRNVTIKGVGSTLGFAYLNTDPDVSYTNLGDSIGFVLEVVPASPTFSVDEGTYNQTQKVTLVSPYNDPNNIASELQTGESADISIKYYLGETKPEEPLTYSGPISISESTKLTAWVEVKYDLLYFSPDQSGSGGSGVTTEIYKSEAVTKSYVINRDIANTTVILANDKTEFTYNEAANVPTITQVYLTEGTETPATTIELTASDYTISYVQVNGDTKEAIEADKIINAGSYKMILTGKGNFSGTKTVAFTINPRPIETPIITLSATEFVYNTQAQKPTVTVQFSETSEVTKTIPATDYEVTYRGDCINVGSYTVSVSLKRNYSGSADGPSFTITKATITPTVTLEGWTYGATANEPSVTGNSGSGDVTYTYKPQNAAEDAYSATKPTNAGAYTVKASIAATANYEAATDSAHFTIAKAAGGLAYSTATASAELNGDGWTAPELKNPNSLAVTYTSSNTAVATISETGVVTLVGTGETTIKAASEGDANHEACEVQYTLTVSRGRALGYGVWVGETEVDEDNYIDILNDGEKDDDGEYTKAPSFIFNPKDTTLLIINSDAGMTIESRLPELKIHLSNDNKLKKIFFNNQGNSENTGKLLFTCDSNFPGSVTIGNTVGESAISGFASVSYEFNLQVLKPAKAKYANGQMTDSLGVVADTITVGVPLEPIKSDDKEELDSDDFTVTNSDGSTATLDLTSANVNNIYYTLPESTEGQGYDPETNTISVVDPMTDDAVEQIAAATTNKNATVGTSEYAESFVGLTFIVQGGEGVIRIDQETEEGYEFHLKIGDKPSIALKSGKEEIEYSLPDATYCWLYLVRKVALARGYTRVSKRDRAPGNVRLVKVQSKVVASTKSAAAASGGTVTPTANLAITGIVDIDKETPESKYTVETVNDKWYTIDGRRIDKPTQKGLYIRNRKKIVVK